MTRRETVGAAQGPAPVTFANVAALLGRLLGLALALGVALGLLLTAAAVALPAPAVEQELGPDRATSGRFPCHRTGLNPCGRRPRTLASRP